MDFKVTAVKPAHSVVVLPPLLLSLTSHIKAKAERPVCYISPEGELLQSCDGHEKTPVKDLVSHFPSSNLLKTYFSILSGIHWHTFCQAVNKWEDNEQNLVSRIAREDVQKVS
jgi:hypothetical protein